MKYRKLRIAFSSLCAVICAMLIALWVQSYFGHAVITRRLTTRTVTVRTDHGELGIWSVTPSMGEIMLLDDYWNVRRLPLTAPDISQLLRSETEVEFFGLRYADLVPLANVLFIPFWLLLLPVAAAGAAPWINWRFGWRRAFSTVCVLATVLLIAFWIRSCKWIDITDRSSGINICSMNGQLFFGEAFMVARNAHPPIPDSHLGICSLRQNKFDLAPMGVGIAIPYWLVVLLSVPIAAVPWLRLHSASAPC
jgi:hypothetical protein